MKNYCCCSARCLATLLLSPAGAALAQGPVITGIAPLTNARAVPRTSSVTVSFNQNLTPASAGALKVFSSQRGGLRSRGATPAVVSGNAVSFAPTAYSWMPGETVSYTVTTGATGSGGTLARGQVTQFTTAVGGTGRGAFVRGTYVGVGFMPGHIAVGDVDGDGDLDLLAIIQNNNTVSVRFNNGLGVFSGTQTVSVDFAPNDLTLGDIDEDGDLDLITTHPGSVSVRLNNGSGTFANGPASMIRTSGIDVLVGDMNGDGSLDLVVSGYSDVSWSPNDGTGGFGPMQVVCTGSGLERLVVGDIDGDGDLDIVSPVTNVTPAIVNICRNNGNGGFALSQQVSVRPGPKGIAMQDLDNDGDLDLLVAGDYLTGLVSIRLNDGFGNFSGNVNLTVDNHPQFLAVCDVDGDGDADILTSSGNYATLSVCLNNGNGTFAPFTRTVIGQSFSTITGDADGDGDLDLFSAIPGTSSSPLTLVQINLNGGTNLTSFKSVSPSGFTVFPNPAHTATTLTGTLPHAPITLLDPLGRPVLTATADAGGRADLRLPAGLVPGLYLVKAGSAVRRLVVE